MTNAVVIGKIFKDVETKKTKTGKDMITFTVACRTAKKKNPEDKYTITNFYRCTVWTVPDWQRDKLVADAPITVCGTLTADAYIGKNGEAGANLSLDNVQILDIGTASDAPKNIASSKNQVNYNNDTAEEDPF